METPPTTAADESYLPSNKMSGMAVSSLVLGILGLVTGCLGIGIIFALIGLVLGIVALVSIGKPGKPGQGKGLAIAGVSVSGAAILLVPLFIGIMLPALGAARRTAQQMSSNTQARGIHQAMVMYAQNQPADANGNRPMTADLGELFVGNYVTADFTQSPMDSIGGDLPDNFMSMSTDDQADWIRQHADFVLIPGLVDDLDTQTLALFGKPDRFDGGIPVTYNDNSTFWEMDVLAVEQQLQAQTGKSMAELIREAEAMSTQP